MTREEAVEVLKERYLTCVGIGLDNHANRVNEAIDMAIEALKADAVHNDSCDGCKYVGVIEKCEQCRRIYTEFDDLYDKGGEEE